MKKRFLALMMSVGMILTLLTGCTADKDVETSGISSEVTSDEKGAKKEVVLNEVAHSIFYAPMYVAIEEGYFEEEGIELTLVCGLGAIQLAQDTLIEINAGNLMFGIDVNLFYNRSPERLTAFP